MSLVYYDLYGKIHFGFCRAIRKMNYIGKMIYFGDLKKYLCVVTLFNSKTLFSVFLFCIVYILRFLF